MCYDAKSSMNGFLIGGAASLYLIVFSNNPTYKHIGLFFAAVVLMQLAEYFIWIDQDCDKNYNSLASKSIVPILAFQSSSLLKKKDRKNFQLQKSIKNILTRL